MGAGRTPREARGPRPTAPGVDSPMDGDREEARTRRSSRTGRAGGAQVESAAPHPARNGGCSEQHDRSSRRRGPPLDRGTLTVAFRLSIWLRCVPGSESPSCRSRSRPTSLSASLQQHPFGRPFGPPEARGSLPRGRCTHKRSAARPAGAVDPVRAEGQPLEPATLQSDHNAATRHPLRAGYEQSCERSEHPSGR